MIRIVPLPDRGDPCANLSCSNRFGNGRWQLVEIDGSPDSAREWERRGMRLSMCAPCADMLGAMVRRLRP